MKRLVSMAISLVVAGLGATTANAAVYVSGSVTDSVSNGGIQSYGNQGGSVSISFDIARFMRLGFTHKQEMQTAEGFTGVGDNDCNSPTNLAGCTTYESSTHVVSNSVDLTLFLYEGQVFMPFVLGGLVVKSYDTTTIKGDVKTTVDTPPQPQPNGGLGLGIRINKDFMFKVTYTVSPGVRLVDPDTKKFERVLDRETDFGLTYQI